MSKKICFFEPDEALAGKLIDYWLGHSLAECSICYYSDMDKWLVDYPSMEADLWILDRSLEPRLPPNLSGKILWWTERSEDTHAVFKYRSAAVLQHTILGYLDKEDSSVGTRLISLYSPVKRCLQTSFGITLSHLLSRKRRILYLNLEGYSGLEKTFSAFYSKDISDFIYYVNQTSENIPLILQKYIYRMGEVDIIPPVINPYHLQDITGDMWLNMLQLLQTSSLYDDIVIDVSDFIHSPFEILKRSQVIFSLTKNDIRSAAKWQQYCSLLEELGHGEILEKTKKTELPHITIVPVNPEYDMQEPMESIVRQIAKEAGIYDL